MNKCWFCNGEGLAYNIHTKWHEKCEVCDGEGIIVDDIEDENEEENDIA